eukprot:scaffold1978_cov381-Prasinococcus_capsulatus_cf.AAC.14
MRASYIAFCGPLPAARSLVATAVVLLHRLEEQSHVLVGRPAGAAHEERRAPSLAEAGWAFADALRQERTSSTAKRIGCGSLLGQTEEELVRLLRAERGEHGGRPIVDHGAVDAQLLPQPPSQRVRHAEIRVGAPPIASLIPRSEDMAGRAAATLRLRGTPAANGRTDTER